MPMSDLAGCVPSAFHAATSWNWQVRRRSVVLLMPFSLVLQILVSAPLVDQLLVLPKNISVFSFLFVLGGLLVRIHRLGRDGGATAQPAEG